MYQINTNERGVIFPLAITLLFVITGVTIFYLETYDAQIKTYNSLESVNVRATISILKEIGR